jgi:hypothetical protein
MSASPTFWGSSSRAADLAGHLLGRIVAFEVWQRRKATPTEALNKFARMFKPAHVKSAGVGPTASRNEAFGIDFSGFID